MIPYSEKACVSPRDREGVLPVFCTAFCNIVADSIRALLPPTGTQCPYPVLPVVPVVPHTVLYII